MNLSFTMSVPRTLVERRIASEASSTDPRSQRTPSLQGACRSNQILKPFLTALLRSLSCWAA
jgi:hypothetical protein